MESIDLHWHVMPPAFIDALRRDGAGGTAHIEVDAGGIERLMLHPGEGVTVEQGSPITPALYDDRYIIAGLDRRKMDVAAISVNPTVFYHWAEPAVGARVARLLNDGIAELVRAHPDRFFGMATLPLQHGYQAAVELERAVTELGLRGAEICTNVNGMDLDHPSLYPVYEVAARLDVPFFIHPQNTGDISRLQEFHLWNLLGFPNETAIAAARLIFAGVFERLPGLKVILAHGGGFFPYQVGRLDHGYAVREEARRYIPRPPSEYLSSIYSDSLIHSDIALRFLLERLGDDHVVLGSDHPFDMGPDDPVDRVRQLGLAPEREAKILSENAVKLLKL